MLRYYEEQGLLSPSRRTSGYRDYDIAEQQKVERIKALGAAGMTLPVIQKFLPCEIENRGEFEPCDELKDILLQQMLFVGEQIGRLEESRTLLSSLLEKIDTAPK